MIRNSRRWPYRHRTPRQVVQEALKASYQETAGATTGIVRQLVLASARDHYLLMPMGWEQNQNHRVNGSIFHIDLIDRQIRIQHDSTGRDIANNLVERDIPKTDTVFGSHAAHKQPYTGFGVGRA